MLPNTYSFPLVGQLAAELLRWGHEVTVFAESQEVCDVVNFQGDHVRLVIGPLRKKRAPYDFYRAERAWLTPCMRHSHCHLIHAHWTYEFAAAAQESGKPTLVTAHDSPLAIVKYFLTGKGAAFWLARTALAARVVRQASHMTTVSPYCRDHLLKTLRPRAHLAVVPNGVEATLLERGRRRLEAGKPSGPFTVATVLEGFSGRKNGKKALQAFHLLRQKVPEATLWMFGTGFGLNEEANLWARANQMDAGVHFLGRLPQLQVFAALSERVDVLLHPSREESFGMAPLEAMALGLAVIGSKNAGGVPYVVGDAGLLEDVENIEAMAEALECLARHPEKRHALAQKGWERAGREFSFQGMVEQYLEQYQNLLGAEKPHRLHA